MGLPEGCGPRLRVSNAMVAFAGPVAPDCRKVAEAEKNLWRERREIGASS